MKRLYIPILFLSMCVAASVQTKPVDTTNAKVVIVKPIIKPELKLADTLKIDLSDKASAVPIDKNRIQIVMVKDKESNSRLKTLLPTINTLMGLFIGFFLTRFYEWYNKRRKFIKMGKRWMIELKTLEDPIKQQVDAMKTFVDSVKLGEWQYKSLELITTINGETFTPLDKNELLEYIQHKNNKPWYKAPFKEASTKQTEYRKAVKISNRTHGFISVLSHTSELLSEKFEMFQDGIQAGAKKFNEDMDLLNKSINEFNFEIMNDEEKIYDAALYSPFLDLYISFIQKLNNDAEYDPFKGENDFLKPAIIELSKLKKDRRILPIMNIITSLFNDYRTLNRERQYIIDDMKELTSRYNDIIGKIDEIVNNINGIHDAK